MGIAVVDQNRAARSIPSGGGMSAAFYSDLGLFREEKPR
jgi:hypothetical protein